MKLLDSANKKDPLSFQSYGIIIMYLINNINDLEMAGRLDVVKQAT